jgi:hypothetical protein
VVLLAFSEMVAVNSRKSSRPDRLEKGTWGVGPRVRLPAESDDRPSWIKVGVIASVGFAVGVLWPRLAGIRLAPNPPNESVSASSAAPLRANDGASAASASAATAAVPAASLAVAPPAAATGTPPTVTVNRGVVLSCKTDDGEALKGFQACGAVSGFDAIAQPRLRKLASCAAADGANGKLAAIFNIDFKSNRVAIDIGKSSTVANIDGISACLKPEFQGVSLGPLDHQNPRYSLFYSTVFSSKGGATAATSPAAGATPSLPAAPAATTATTPVGSDSDGTAQVVWEVAIVRDNPRTGQVVARLQRGTKIRLGAGQDGWYRVQYGNSFASEGWVYRGAIGR